MARLVAGAGFALDFDENRVSGGHVYDAFTLTAAGHGLGAGAGALAIDRTEGDRAHRTVLDYTGVPGGGRFTALRDHDAAGRLRYTIEGMDITLPASGLDALGAQVFASIGEIEGGAGDDVWYMGIPGHRRFDGHAGVDRVIYRSDPRYYTLQDGVYRAEAPIVVALGPNVYGVASRDALDILVDVELITIDGRTVPIQAAAFDGLTYLASYPDLAAAFGTDLGLAARHYAGSGRNEGRAPAAFNAFFYAAANPDVAAAFGVNAAAITTHYVQHGWREGRRTTFDAAAYLAVNPDVAAAFGSDLTAAARHYVEHGRIEGRRLGPGRAAGEAVADKGASVPSDGPPTRGTVTGTTGNDTLTGTVVTDIYGNRYVQDDQVDGLTGIDTFTLTGAIGLYGYYRDAYGRIVLTGPEGTDTLTSIEMIQATDGLFNVGRLLSSNEPSTSGMTPSADATTGNDYLVGTPWNDVLGGNLGNDTLEGLAGNDQLFGHDGFDVLLGGDGNDRLYGAAGNDRLYGGTGNDTLEGDTLQTASDDLLDGGTGNDTLTGGKGRDILFGAGGVDTLFGDAGCDTLQGGDDADLLVGDQITNRYVSMIAMPGESYDDVLFGGGGADVLMGGLGADLLEGGLLGDRFVFANLNESTLAAPDIILDFNGPHIAAAALRGFAHYATPGTEGDKIDLSEINAIDGLPTNQEFTFIGTAPFTAAGQLRCRPEGAVTYIEGNVKGDLAADLRIQVNIANYRFTIYDFIL